MMILTAGIMQTMNKTSSLIQEMKWHPIYQGTCKHIPFGMEHLQSRKYVQKRVMMKRLVQLAVLSEQARHIPHEHPSDKQDRIAIASMQRSKWSRVQARVIGIAQLSQQDVSEEK